MKCCWFNLSKEKKKDLPNREGSYRHPWAAPPPSPPSSPSRTLPQHYRWRRHGLPDRAVKELLWSWHEPSLAQLLKQSRRRFLSPLQLQPLPLLPCSSFLLLQLRFLALPPWIRPCAVHAPSGYPC